MFEELEDLDDAESSLEERVQNLEMLFNAIFMKAMKRDTEFGEQFMKFYEEAIAEYQENYLSIIEEIIKENMEDAGESEELEEDEGNNWLDYWDGRSLDEPGFWSQEEL